MTPIGENLRRIREQRRLSQPALAELSGVPQPTISKLERGHREPHQATLRRLARALDVGVGDLLIEDEVGEARARLERMRANCALLEGYMENPPDEATWDRAAGEFYAFGSEHLKIAIRHVEQAQAGERPLDRELLDEVWQAGQARDRVLARMATFNLAQYGHRHRDAG
jgi:transcriptional regulator with XRE-family HTH domain